MSEEPVDKMPGLTVRGDDGIRILFATDGSPGAAVALDTLAALPLRPIDEVVIVSYPTYLLAARPGGGGIIARLMERELNEARTVVSTTIAALSAATKALVRGFVPTGLEAVDAIVRAALDTRADLIVVGSRGRRLLSSLVLGSTARTVAMITPVPILIVRQRRTDFGRVLVAYDGSVAALAALALVTRLPLPKEARLTLATVLPVRDWPDPGADGELRSLRERVEREDGPTAQSCLKRRRPGLLIGGPTTCLSGRAPSRCDPRARRGDGRGSHRARVSWRRGSAPAVLGQHRRADCDDRALPGARRSDSDGC